MANGNASPDFSAFTDPFASLGGLTDPVQAASAQFQSDVAAGTPQMRISGVPPQAPQPQVADPIAAIQTKENTDIKAAEQALQGQLQATGTQMKASVAGVERTQQETQAAETAIMEKGVANLEQHYAKAEADAERVAQLREQQAAQLQTADQKLMDWAQKQPTRQAAYANVMHLSPLLAVLTAVGGAATRASGLQMLAATNGVVQGVKEGAENQFTDAVNKWQTAYAAMKEHMANTQKVFDTYAEAYQGRADAQEKAAEHTNTVMQDQLQPQQLKMGNALQLHNLKQAMFNMLDNHALAFEKIKEAQANRQAKAAADAQMTQDAAYLAATQMIHGARMSDVVPYSRGGGFRAQVMNLIPQLWAQEQANNPKYQGAGGHQRMLDDLGTFMQNARVDLVAQTSAARAAGTIGGKVEQASNEITGWIPLARAASDAVGRTRFVPFNEQWEKGLANISDRDMQRFVSYTNSILNAYNILSARGGTDIDVRRRNLRMLSEASSPEAYAVALQSIQTELEVAKGASIASMHRAAYLDRTPLQGEDALGGGANGTDLTAAPNYDRNNATQPPWTPLQTVPRDQGGEVAPLPGWGKAVIQ